MNLILTLTCARYLVGTLDSAAGEKEFKSTYFFYLDPVYSSEYDQECLKHCLGLVPCCLAPDIQKKYVSESSSAGCHCGMGWEKESFMPEEFSFCCCQSYWCYGLCLQLEESNCRHEGKLGPMSKQTISYNLHSWVQARRRCEDMQQASLRAYPEKAHGSKLPGSHWY